MLVLPGGKNECKSVINAHIAVNAWKLSSDKEPHVYMGRMEADFSTQFDSNVWLTVCRGGAHTRAAAGRPASNR